MVRTYSVKYKSKSKMLTDAEKVEAAKKAILDETSIEAEEDEFTEVMNTVVNVFRKIDDKSEVSYKFALNMNR